MRLRKKCIYFVICCLFMPFVLGKDRYFRENLCSNFEKNVFSETGEFKIGSKQNEHLLIDGWSHSEISHRWAVGTSSNLFYFTFHPEVDKELTIKCFPFSGIANQEIKIFLNDHPVGATRFDRNSQQTIRITLPAKFQKNYFNILRFEYRQAKSPASVGHSDDERELSVGFKQIQLRHASGQSTPVTTFKYNQGSLRFPVNSALIRDVYISAGAQLTLNVEPVPQAASGTFSVVAVLHNQQETLFSISNITGSIRKKIDLTDYADQFVQLFFMYKNMKPSVTINEKQAVTVKAELSHLHRPNLLFIVVDTLRADHVGVYNRDVKLTPNIDALASKGVRFDNAYCHIPITLPSHATMFTGKYPHQLGVLNNGFTLAHREFLLSEVLKRAGYYTLGIVSLSSLSPETRINQGFHRYLAPEDIWYDNAQSINIKVKKNVQHLPKNKPYFFFLHYTDPHDPYHGHGLRSTSFKLHLNKQLLTREDIANQNLITIGQVNLKRGKNILQISSEKDFYMDFLRFETGQKAKISWKFTRGFIKKGSHYTKCRKNCTIEVLNNSSTTVTSRLKIFVKEVLSKEEARQSYQQEVKYVDQKIGEIMPILRRNGLLKNTIIIFTSDHGEALLEHNHLGHIQDLYDTMTKVPLIMIHPRIYQSGKVVNSLVSHIDLFPTILDDLGLYPPRNLKLTGQDLKQFLSVERQRSILGMTFQPEARHNLVSLLNSDFKIIFNLDTRKFRLYNRAQDPEEMHNIADKNFILVNRMDGKLQRIMLKENFPAEPDKLDRSKYTTDKKRLDALRGLGYIK